VLLTEIQGPSKVSISAAECRSVTVALMADAYEVLQPFPITVQPRLSRF